MNGENGGDSAGMNGDGTMGSRQRGPRRGGGRPPLDQGNRKAGTSGGEGGTGGRGILVGGGRGQAKPRTGP